MEATERSQGIGGSTAAVATVRGVAARLDPGGVATWLLAAGLVVYLALENGGYDTIPRSEVGLAVWWIVLCGALAGVVAITSVRRAGLVVAGLLLGFAVWTALALGWTESQERTAIELARVATYLGVLALGLGAVVAGRGRQLLNGVTFGVLLIAGLAVLSRLHPAWFPANELGAYLPGIEIERRLAYPLNYSSAVGALAAIAIPLALGAAWWARTPLVRALAAASLPLVGLALYLATSGTGVAAAAIGLLAFVVLVPDRLPKLATLAAGGAGAAILAAAVDQRDALSRGLPSPLAEQQGDEVLAMAAVVCAGVGLVHAGIALAVAHGRRPAWLAISPRAAWVALAVAATIALPGLVAAGAPGTLSDAWETFKSREGDGATQASGASRGAEIINTSSSGRYQFWEGAVEANEADPLKGIGPGTFEFWWSREGTEAGFIRDAHSLYAETLGEAGIVGFALICAFVLAVILTGAARALSRAGPARLALAAATAACAAFAVAAGLDWVWELAALPVVFLLLAALATTWSPESARARRRTRRPSALAAWVPRVAVAVVALLAIYAIWQPLRGASALADSRVAARTGELEVALEKARDASDAQPYAATPRLQEALILERLGDLDAAAAAATQATRNEPTNWRPWIVLSRIEAERGRPGAAVAAFREASALNPRSGALAR